MDNPVMRFTPQAVDTLNDLAQTRPELWADPATDFQAELERLNLTDHSEPTHIAAAAPIEMPPATGYPRSLGDLPALDFYANLIGLRPKDLTDIGIMAWIAHQRLHDFAPNRWPQNLATTNWIRQHYLSHRHADLARANLAGRLLWLAQTAHRAAGASGGAFTPRQALEHFCRYPEQYHTAVNSYNVLASDLALAEYVHAQMQGAYQHDRRGLALAQALNLLGGAVIIDALPRQAIRYTFSAAAQRLAEANAKKTLQVLSLGAGVQSTVMALMADQEYDGFSKPDFAIFADTGWEPKGVYEHLDWLETQLSYPVIRVSNGNIKDCVLNGQNPDGQPFMDLPVHVVKADGKHYIGKRQCTNHFKLKPIRDYLRQRLDAQPGKPIRDAEVVMWLGISRDEASRQKPSREPWITNVYPLLERDISRTQLELWFQERYPEHTLPKSACIGCPYHTDRFWANMKANDPESWNDAVGVDWALRNNPATKGSIDGAAYLHRSRQPLNQVELAVAPNSPESNEMEEECEGLCGV